MKQKIIGYYKGDPTQWQRMLVDGKVVREGRGITRLYFPFRTTIDAVAMTALDQPFGFREMTLDNQEATLQGSFVYRVNEPGKVLDAYNLVIDPNNGAYLGDGQQKVPEHLLELIRAETRGIVQAQKLEDLLTMTRGISTQVLEEMSKSGEVSRYGLHIENVHFASIVGKPEIMKGLEATYREALLTRAEAASYARREAGVLKERGIKEEEMKTQMSLEEERKKLVELQSANVRAEAMAKAEALKLELNAFGDLDADLVRAHALYLLGRNAAHIETLTITPELLAGLRK